MRALGGLLAAALAGAGGLMLESLLIQSIGLVLGHGAAGALGLSVYVAGWAAGAWLSGRSRAAPRWRLLAGALLAGPLGWLALQACFHPGVQALADPLQLVAGVLILFVPALGSGLFLPALLAGSAPAGALWQRAATLIAASLLGALGGATLLDRVLEARGDRSLAGWLFVLAFVAALLVASPTRAHPPARRASGPLWTRSGLALGLATAALLGLEWVGLRLATLSIGGMQPALDAALSASLLALCLGAWLLPPLLWKQRHAAGWILLLATAGVCWPHLAVRVLPPDLAPIPAMLLLIGPGLAALGALPGLLHRDQEGDAGERLGALYLHELWGALAFLPLAHAWLVPRFGTHGLLVACAVLLCAGAFALRQGRLATLAGVGAALACAWLLGSPARQTAPLQNPAFTLRSFAEDREFAVSVVDDGLLGERTLLTDGFRAAGTGSAYRYMQALGHLPVLLHPAPRAAAVLALGTGTTLGALAQHPELTRIDVLEISPAVVAAAPLFEANNRGVLTADPRIRVRLGDGRRTLAASPAQYDLVTMEPLLPDSPFGVYLYTEEFYRLARASLRPGGLVCQWIPPHALEPASFQAVLRSFQRAFPWSGAWLFGTQLVLIGGEQPFEPRPERFSLAPELGQRLRALGLDSVARVRDARVLECRAAPALPGLSDARPWIIYAPRRSGAQLLLDLPRNLDALLRLRSEPAGCAAGHRWRARIAFAREEARLRGALDPALEGYELEAELSAARRQEPDSAELAALDQEIGFVTRLRNGVALLESEPRSALETLLSAERFEGQRADVHLYIAVALHKLGSKAAPKALARARELCPRIGETREGQRARELGLPGL
jgi:spermidine synthase